MKTTLPLLLLLSLAANGLTQSFATDFNPRPHGDEASKAGLNPDMLLKLDAALQRAVENREVAGVIGLIYRNAATSNLSAGRTLKQRSQCRRTRSFD